MKVKELIKKYREYGYKLEEQTEKRVVMSKEIQGKIVYQVIEDGQTVLTRSVLKAKEGQ